MLVFLFVLFLVFIYSVNAVQVCNVVYYIIMFKNKNVKLKNRSIVIAYMLFIVWVLISTTVYNCQYQTVFLRTIIQFLFTLQYFVFILDLDINIRKFEILLKRISIILASMIIILYFSTHTIGDIRWLHGDRGWGRGYFPGWPNGTATALIIASYISCKHNNKNIFEKILFFLAAFLTTSRTSLYGIILVLSYFIVKRMLQLKNKVFMFLFMFLFLFLFMFKDINVLEKIYELVPSAKNRWFYLDDRFMIVRDTFEYIKRRPFLGYGGNSYAQMFQIYGNNGAYNWQQTHNTLLEITLRYGIIGLILFLNLIRSVFLSIKDIDKKVVFLILFILSFFQIFIREFSYLFFMVYLSMDSNSDLAQRETNVSI